MTQRTTASPQHDMDTLLTSPEVSNILRVPEKTLANWRSAGKGPRSLRIGRHVRYRRSDLLAWLEEQ